MSTLRVLLLALAVALSALAALAFWLAATPAAADDVYTCGKASGEEAIEACTRAIDSGQYSGRQLAALFNNRCSEWNGKHESDKALADCSQAIGLDPDYALAFFNHGNAYFAEGQYDRAIEDYDQSIRLNPNYAHVFNNRGNTYSNIGQRDHAIEDYSQAIRLNPKHADAFYNRGIAYDAEGDHDSAIT